LTYCVVETKRFVSDLLGGLNINNKSQADLHASARGNAHGSATRPRQTHASQKKTMSPTPGEKWATQLPAGASPSCANTSV
jgi:hypothetical protein